MNKTSKIFIAGHNGLAGSAIKRHLNFKKFQNLLVRSRKELDLMKTDEVNLFFDRYQPEFVILAAARVGGIVDNNTHPVDFIRDNIAIQWNIIEASYKFNVKRLLFLGSSCIYPTNCPRPIKEEYFLSGKLEPTNQAYAVAKIAGIEHCWSYNRQFSTNFICAMPTNLYGPNDNYELDKSHVLAALIRKIHEAKINNKESITLWGTGKPKREFLHVDDLATACIHLLSISDQKLQDITQGYYQPPIINIGTGQELSILELSKIISKTIGYEGNIFWDHTKPDGVFSKVMDINLMKRLGWSSTIQLTDGIKKTYDSFLNSEKPRAICY